jgi:hypothetical protein
MAIIKRIASKWSLKKIIDYVLSKDKTAEKIISGKDCSPENALSVMSATKKLYNKTEGRSYNHIIQSFKPGEVEPGMAHEIGKELAEKQFKNYEVLISTHIDKEHVHNHFVVNSVSFVDGRKLDSSKQSLIELKRESNRICKERGLSVIEKPYGRNVYSMAEYKMAEKGMSLWKEQLRAAIDEAKENSRNIVEMRDYLEDNFNINMKIQNKNLSFLHPDKQKYCRGNKLGFNYTKDEIMRYFERGPELENVDMERTMPDESKSSFGLSKVGFGIEGIAKKIARDIEKEKIRVDKVKIRKDKAREKYKVRKSEKDRSIDRDKGFKGI